MAKVADAITSLDKEQLLMAVRDALESGVDPMAVIEDARFGLERVGSEFEKGNFFLMELMYASQIFKDAMEIVGPRIKERYGARSSKGRILLGTVKGDIHDLGKSIVRDLLECSGYDVLDLGVDVPPQTFAEKTSSFNPQVVGMSALLTAAVNQASGTLDELRDRGLRDRVKVIMGGGVVGEINARDFGLDYATVNASEGIRVIERWIEEAK